MNTRQCQYLICCKMYHQYKCIVKPNEKFIELLNSVMQSVFKGNYPVSDDNHVHHNKVAQRVSKGIKILGTARIPLKTEKESMAGKKTINRKQ